MQNTCLCKERGSLTDLMKYVEDEFIELVVIK